LLLRAGFDSITACVILVHLNCAGINRNATYDPYAWGDRTFFVAHQYIERNWGSLESGEVLDVEYILGESKTPKVSERVG